MRWRPYRSWMYRCWWMWAWARTGATQNNRRFERLRTTALILFCLLLTACSSSDKKETAAEAPKKPVETKAPPSFKVKFDTSEGGFTMDCTRDLAPAGADRFYELVNRQFFDDTRFFRVIKNFVVQL